MYVPKSVSRLEDQIIGRIDAERRRQPPKVRADHPRSPAACMFTGAEITASIAENAEAVSLAWRRRIRATRSSGVAV